jgi:SPP1 family phage portal protein
MLFNSYKYATMLDANGGVPTVEIIKDAIKDHAELKRQTLKRYGRYQQTKEDTPIMQREEPANKINNKLANDYFGEIVDTKVGYMFGQPVSVLYDKSAPSHEKIVDKISTFKKINHFDDLNAEFCKFSAMTGYDAALCYIEKATGEERLMRVDPWEAIIISKTNYTEPEYGIHYYTTWDDKARVDFYNGSNRYVFEGKDFSSIEEKTDHEENKPHMFKYCPLVGVPNNAELQGDGDKVFSLIDGFDRSISDMNNEIEQFRLAYMIFVGYEPDQDTIDEMKRTGALFIPTSKDGEKIDWLIKTLDPTYPDSHLDRLEANITRFAKHVNFTDAAFGGDITGPAMRYKLFALETKSKYFERKHESAMLHIFKVIGSAWQTKSIPFDYTKLDLSYTRNIPVNLLDEAQTAVALSGITSKRTALGSLSVVEDVDEELARIEDEAENEPDLDEIAKQKEIDVDDIDADEDEE